MNETKREEIKVNDDEQYKIIMSMYDNEITRFYTRQNLYLGLQMIVFTGIIAGIDKLIMTKTLLVFTVFFTTIVSFFNALIAWRGLKTQKLTVGIIQDIEKRSLGKWDILSLAKNNKESISMFFNFKISFIFACFLFVFWLMLAYWLFTAENI